MRHGLFGMVWLGWLGLLGCGQGVDVGAMTSATESAEIRQASSDSSSNRVGTIERRMVFRASLRVEVMDFDRWVRSMEEKVDEVGAYISQHSEQRQNTDYRMANWSIRVPSTQFSTLLAWLDESSTITNRQVTSQDRTEEYVDIQSRIANKRETLNRMKELFASRSQSLPDVLAGEKEIDRVGQELERMEGHLMLLENETAMSTIELEVSTPSAPVAVVHFNFRQRWEKAALSSWYAFVKVGEWLLIALTASLPWCLSAMVLWLVGSRGFRYWLAVRKSTTA